MTQLESTRLTLRRLEPTDAAFILRLLNEPSFLRFIGDKGVRSLDDARKYLNDGPIASYRRHGFGLYLTCLRGRRSKIGICGLVKRDALPAPDLGFAFLEQYAGKGYATEAAAAVLAHARRDLHLRRVVAITAPENRGSMGVLEKVGLIRRGTIRLAADSPPLNFFCNEPGVETAGDRASAGVAR